MALDVLEEISRIGMIPVLTIENADGALPLARALAGGGLPLMEVMFRSDAAADAIGRIAKEFPEFLVGAGTVLTPKQAEQAVKAGAKFLVAPGFNPEVVKAAQQLGTPIVPGTVTPTEVEAARALGLHVLKFFPAVQQGGVPVMKLLSGPYPDVRFVPTGDLTRELTTEYLQFNRVAAAGGDYMTSYADIRAGNYEKIRKDTEDTVLGYLNFHVAHVGLNGSSPVEAAKLCGAFCEIFKVPVRQGSKSAMAGGMLEVMNKPFYYEKGHIAIGTRDATRAYWYLKRRGYEFLEDTVSKGNDGRIVAAYLKEPLAGFALHLVQD